MGQILSLGNWIKLLHVIAHNLCACLETEFGIRLLHRAGRRSDLVSVVVETGRVKHSSKEGSPPMIERTSHEESSTRLGKACTEGPIWSKKSFLFFFIYRDSEAVG